MYGMKKYVDEVVKWLETRMLPMEFEEKKTGKKFMRLIECQLRPGMMGTWEFIFPETSKDLVFTGLKCGNPVKPGMKLGAGWKIAALRKSLKLKKIPEFNKESDVMAIPNTILDFVQIIPIGVRYDPVREVHDSGYIHEAI